MGSGVDWGMGSVVRAVQDGGKLVSNDELEPSSVFGSVSELSSAHRVLTAAGS